MTYCPIISYHNTDVFPRKDCMGKDCALYDEVAGGCLIRTFLITQIEKSDIIVPSKKKEATNEIERFMHTRPGD